MPEPGLALSRDPIDPDRNLLLGGCGLATVTRADPLCRVIEPVAATSSSAGAPPDGSVRLEATHLPFGDATIDAVWCSDLLHQARDPGSMLAEIERVLRPGGRARMRLAERTTLRSRLGRRRRLRVGRVLDAMDRELGLRLLDATQGRRLRRRRVLKVPGLRELTAGNSVLEVERVARPPR